MGFRSFRDNLLVTMGARAAYMHDRGDIELPSGVEGERKIAEFVANTIDQYLQKQFVYGNFDQYIETALMKEYGVVKDEKQKLTEFDISANNLDAVVEEMKCVIRSYRPGTIEHDVHYAMYKCVQYLEQQIRELDKRTRC